MSYKRCDSTSAVANDHYERRTLTLTSLSRANTESHKQQEQEQRLTVFASSQFSTESRPT